MALDSSEADYHLWPKTYGKAMGRALTRHAPHEALPKLLLALPATTTHFVNARLTLFWPATISSGTCQVITTMSNDPDMAILKGRSRLAACQLPLELLELCRHRFHTRTNVIHQGSL